MKKIIYSLVIMIAAGSLFTSCIEQLEPVGILDLRNAKAEYIRSLTKLRAADAELQLALAEVEKANARYRDAETAYKNAETDSLKEIAALQAEYQRLVNEAKSIENDFLREDYKVKQQEVLARIEAIQQQMENNRARHEIDMVTYQQLLAEAQEALRIALRNIALASKELTAVEQAALNALLTAYEQAYNDVIAQDTVVNALRYAVADAQAELEAERFDKEWDSASLSYQYKVDLWQKGIETAKEIIAEDEALLAGVPSPDVADLNKWQEEFDKLHADSVANEFSRYKIVQEAANYYVNYVHDGRKTWNDFIDAWKAENYWEDADGNKTIKPTEPTKPTKPTAPKAYTEGSYTWNGTDYRADSIILPGLELKVDAAYTKFLAMVAADVAGEHTYTEVASPASKMDPKTKVLYYNGSADTLFGLVSNKNNMKDFVLGDADNTEALRKLGDAKVDYSLKGAIDILKRDKVLNPETPADPDKAKAAMDSLQKVWKEHRDTLAAGLAAYEPYTQAVAALEALGDGGAAAMVEATNNFVDRWNEIAGKSAWTINDTTSIYNAIVSYAAAREGYLDYEAGWTAGRDSTKFYWSKASSPFEADSVKFSALSMDKLRERQHRAGYRNSTSETNFPDGVSAYAYWWEGSNKGKEPYAYNTAFAAIFRQLFGDKMRELVNKATADAITSSNVGDILATTNFYGKYKPVMDTENPIHVKGFKNADDTDYVPSSITEAQDAIVAAVQRYKEIYEMYWNATWPGTVKIPTAAEIETWTDNEINVEKYTENTFIKPYFITTFDASGLLWTKGLGVILGSVDDNAGDTKGTGLNNGGYVDVTNGTGSVVFGTTNSGVMTDLYNYMKAYYLWQLALNPTTESIKALEAWVVLVEEAFANDVTSAIAKAKGAYDTAVALYNTAMATYEAKMKEYNTKKEAWDKYEKALTEFVGTHPVSGEPVLNQTDVDNMKFNLATEYTNVESIYNGAVIPFKFMTTDLVWNKKLIGGTALTKFEEIFPKAVATWQDWDARTKKINDLAAHYQMLCKALGNAYLAAAKVAGYTEYVDFNGDKQNLDDATWYMLMADYNLARENYVKAIKSDIDKQNDTIEDNTKNIADFKSGKSAYEIKLARLEADLLKAEALLQKYEDRLDIVKEALDNLLAYLQGTGAEFILPDLTGVASIPAGTPTGPNYDFDEIWFPGGEPSFGGTTLNDLVDWIKSIFS